MDRDIQDKACTVEELARIAERERAAGKRVVLCHGVFDLLHIGHLRYFNQAREMGDVLLVTLTPDAYVDKGPNRPAFTQAMRLEAVTSLSKVDYAAVNEWPTAVETIRRIRPDVYVKGSDFTDAASDRTGKLAEEKAACEAVGAELAFTRDVIFSSTTLINRFFSSYPEEVREYLQLFSRRYPLKALTGWLERMAGLKVMVIGDTILDDYRYCSTIGVATKDPALVVREESGDLFVGGALAVANHLAGLAGSVKLFTVIGGRDDREPFIRENLRPNVEPHFAIHRDAPTITKRRFIEGYSSNKLFEVYEMAPSGPDAETDAAFVEAVGRAIGDCDLVVMADFGHGTVSPALRALAAGSARFLAVNAQTNAGNKGKHHVSLYPRADYLSLAYPELQLENRDGETDDRALAERVMADMGAKALAVTMGKKGSIQVNAAGEFVKTPALAVKVLDRIGSGDAFLSITSLAACLDAPLEVLGFLGNVAGALAVNVMGNKDPIDAAQVEKFVTALLK